MHVIEPSPMLYSGQTPPMLYPIDYDTAKSEAAHVLAGFASSELPKVDVSSVAEIGDAASIITAFADGVRADLIAMPTHGCGRFRRMLVGSTTARVLHDATVPVWTSAHATEASHRAHPQPRTILAALDLGPESRSVLNTALELACDAAAQVHVLHLAPEGQLDQQAASRCRDLLNELAKDDMTTECGETEVTVEAAQAGEAVGDVVRRIALASRADLVVIGRGNIRKGGFSRLRANAYEIVRDAPCPVLSV
jgi:nucleotide-binding universal stress UspA family protein